MSAMILLASPAFIRENNSLINKAFDLILVLAAFIQSKSLVRENSSLINKHLIWFLF